ncbi:tetraacyldisaccharide 4'-kinase [Aureimonas phyllosphaerae]|uniref:Tetraacyldisaccharide 4'-kinase n=1 Tax=Aureimonas phyllosphaerae TaxID=1166078 RepID=A0A7W6BRQ4_9HYPH|nr:tetraacyldisaccharide 4'-kinase [Aureimonas phyllosphaerae]MBB3936844.1 tetraacyldisaccharide 4'-kinase [Aureimonas phyllosphaerae]MBB3961041.1 tetraacyldisaccharide 4'-kinase [Aureimonas phyllosphaerae]SFF26556.1 lipid-A-disaccharide kinase [Aureimonas phyllosphaerae]
MIPLRAPRFWFEPFGWQAALLEPAAFVYGRVAARRMAEAPRRQAAAPVICIGNFTLGGGGKTPTAMALAEAARALGRTPGFLTRGHGGASRLPLLVEPDRHGAALVGDEALLLAERAPTAASPDRAAGALLLRHAGCDLFLMDDGFQSAQLQPDLALLVVDGATGLGNGRTFPAGPLRAPLGAQWPHADALLVIGAGEPGDAVARRAAADGKPVHRARLATVDAAGLRGVRCLAFAGIANPGKFHASLEEVGAKVETRRDFPDHHPFTEAEAHAILSDAEAKGLVPVTTAKDHVRLLAGGPQARLLGEAARVLRVALRFEDPAAPEAILLAAEAAFRARPPAVQPLAAAPVSALREAAASA